MRTKPNDRSEDLGFKFEEEPKDLDDMDFSAPPLPQLVAGKSPPTDFHLGYMPAGGYPHIQPSGPATGAYVSVDQTTQRWKTYRLLAHCFVWRDYVITGPTDMIGGIHHGNVVVAHEQRGMRVKVRLPTYGWYGTSDYYGEEFGWMDMNGPNGEPLMMEMQPALPSPIQGQAIIGHPNEEVVYPTVQVIQPPTPTTSPPITPPIPVVSGYQPAECTPQTPTLLRNHDAFQHAVYQPTALKDLPNLYQYRTSTPSQKINAVTPKATPVSSSVAATAVTKESAAGQKPRLPPLQKPRLPPLRKPLMPVPMVPPKAVNPIPTLEKKPSKRSADLPGTGSTPATTTSKPKRHGGRGRRRGVYRDKHQALVSHTPGVILYPRDPVTGHVIIPKHLVAAHRKNRRPPCRTRRGPNSWGKKRHGHAKA